MRFQKADIVFVTPSYEKKLTHESIGTLILAKRAQLAGFNVEIVRFCDVEMGDYASFRHNLISIILNYSPHIVSFYCRAAEYPILIDIVEHIKTDYPKITTVFGGPQAELVAEDTLTSFSGVDYVCCGEGENTIVPLLDLLITYHNKTDLTDSIPGLVYRDKNGSICKNKLPEFLSDNYTRHYNYYDLIPQDIISNSDCVTIDVGRGCPFSCSFCSTKAFWKQKFRLRNIHDTTSEIKYVITNLGIKSFSFSHDLFTANKSRVLQFCHTIQSESIAIRWNCSSRIDCIDHEMIDNMVSAGLVAIYYGIETGSPRMQTLINKKIDIDDARDIVQYSIKKGVAVTTSFIYGFPQETEEDLEHTLELIHQFLKIGVNVQLHCLALEKGSSLYEAYHQELFFSPNKISNSFGIKELSTMIENYPKLFSTFWDFKTPLRVEMRFLHELHTVGRAYPSEFVKIIECLRRNGMTYVDAYRFLIKILEDSFIKFANSNVTLSKAICYFLILKITAKITSDSSLKKHYDK